MMKRMLALAVIAAGAAGTVKARQWWTTWGIEPGEGEASLPGDELVPEPTMSDTRGITIDAPPAAVWPWLVQLGYGRGGWYSYDRLDTRGESANEIRPEWQSLSVGDIVPTDPDGGFEVRVLEPGHALVLMVDNALVARQRSSAASPAGVPAGVAASGRFMQSSMPPEFAVSWAIVLELVEGGRTRLIERIRGRFGEGTAGSRALAPLLGFGVFVMTQRQMLGLKERAERPARSAARPAPATAAASPMA